MKGRFVLAVAIVSAGLASLVGGCSTRAGAGTAPAGDAAIEVSVAVVARQPVPRTISVTGSLTADEEAEVAAETAGRVVSTPVERGTRVNEGDPLVAIAATEAEASAREAGANVAQLEARLALAGPGGFDPERVPEVAAAKASRDLAEADFNRIRSLLDQRVVSQAEFDQRRTQVEATSNQYDAARNNARQLFRQYEAATARLALARKALADTTVRSPFAGLVVERKVSVGDFATRGAKVATVVRVNPLRLELTVPEQFVASIRPGQAITLRVDAYAGRDFSGRVRFVSPALRADQRALVVEAVVPNAEGLLKPGFFASATIDGGVTEVANLVPTAALRNDGSVSRLYVIRANKAEEHLVKLGQAVGALVEIASGVDAGDTVATSNVAQLTDGARVRVPAQGASR